LPNSEEFDLLVRDMFSYLMKRDPILATYLGLHNFDGELPNGSREAYILDLDSKEQYLSKFESFGDTTLTNDEELDRKLAVYGIELELFSGRSLNIWQSHPNCSNTIGDSLFPLFSLEFASLESRLLSITERIEKSPVFIDEIKTRILRPVKIWIGIEIESLNNLPIFLDTIISGAKSKQLMTSRLDSAVNELKDSLEDYKSWLIREVLPNSIDEFAIGVDNFEELIKLRGFEMTSREILEFGKLALKREKKCLEEISLKIDSRKSISEIKKSIDLKHSKSFDKSLILIKDTVKATKEFVQKHRFARVPENEDLIVMETPTYLRNVIPFAAYFSPSKFDSKKVGIYLTTPGEKDDLGKLNFASISNTAVHEGYPGHHLQLSYNALHPSLIRTLFQGVEFIEGWAHYCEEVMKEMGWRDNLETRFIQTMDLVWRAARVIIDVELSTGSMSFDEAVKLLIKETGMQKKSAISEVKRYTYSPGYQLSYYLGKHLILELRKEIKRMWGFDYSNYRFHNKLLSSGGLPINLLKNFMYPL